MGRGAGLREDDVRDWIIGVTSRLHSLTWVVGADAYFSTTMVPLVYQAIATSLEVFKYPFSERAQRWLVEVKDNGEKFGIDFY